MPGIARGDGVDTVASLTGSGLLCAFPLTTATAACSGDVFVNKTGVVRQGDIIAAHPIGGCGIDASTVTVHSSTVRANGMWIARLGDQYTADNTITSASGDVSAG